MARAVTVALVAGAVMEGAFVAEGHLDRAVQLARAALAALSEKMLHQDRSLLRISNLKSLQDWLGPSLLSRTRHLVS